MQVELPIVDSTTCNSKNYYNGFVNPKVMICAGYHEGKRGSCQVKFVRTWSENTNTIKHTY